MSVYQLTCWNLTDFLGANGMPGLTGGGALDPDDPARITLAADAECTSLELGNSDHSAGTAAPKSHPGNFLLDDLNMGRRCFKAGSEIVVETVLKTHAAPSVMLIICRIIDAGSGPGGCGFQVVFSSAQLSPGQSFTLSGDKNAPITGPGKSCFARGTLIETPHGQQPVEQLEDGDEVLTHEGQVRLISWIGNRRISGLELVLHPRLRPVLIKAGALTGGRPGQDLAVSQNHRLLVDDWRAPYLFGEDEILVPARSLLNDTTVTISCPLGGIEYYHLLVDGHAMVCANGLWAETMLPDPATLAMLTPTQRAEISLHPGATSGTCRSVLPALPHGSARSVAA